ncbi:unnamed protein product [Staurois parvus]|uniref:Uncharacterized protein n=1 Tax=Staurois parvus TaxID=386267 RepID=A0ABN9B4H4_9NEOB|nr:unnamed protein product [Staurois parvus]
MGPPTNPRPSGRARVSKWSVRPCAGDNKSVAYTGPQDIKMYWAPGQ